MRGQAAALAVFLLGMAAPAGAQSEQAAEESRTAEEFLETARRIYAVDDSQPDPEPCAAATEAEIVVCRQRDRVQDQRLRSPTERARANDELPPDPVPRAPDVFGLPPCKSQAVCVKVGRAPPPIYIIDLSKIPEALSPEEAALVFRAEDLPEQTASPAAASPAEAP